MSQKLSQYLGAGHCGSCKLSEVVWRRGSRGVRLVHEGGKASCRFPCRTACDHIDCEAARDELAGRTEQ